MVMFIGLLRDNSLMDLSLRFHTGYNLRSHEVHDAAHDDPQPTHYKHSEVSVPDTQY